VGPFTIDALVTGLVAGVVLRWAALLVLALWDWVVQRRHAPDPADVEPLTAIVPAWNEGPVIARTITSLLASDLPDLTVIVVDDGSTDDTARVVERLAADEPRVRLVRQPANAGKPAALNAGIQRATTRLVATVDADTLVDPACLRWLTATQRRRQADGVAANVRVGNRRGLLPRWQSLEYVAGLNLDRRALHRLGLITTVPGACALWRREAVLGVGGFTDDTLAEDTDLSLALLRTGGSLALQDRARAYTEAPATLGGLVRQRRRWLSGNLRCIAKHGLGQGAPLAVRLIALPNLWFAHLGVYLLPLLVSAWVALGRGGAELAALGALGGVAMALDLTGLLAFYALDRADPRDLPHVPVQRFFLPTLLWLVFVSVLASPPRGWGKITRRNTASVG
jgi:cellulose synthase/poly-beta-1,6-N-acetylglucosamine synthase-like glycosyltransferase